MAVKPDVLKAELIDKLAAMAHAKLGGTKGAQAETFIRRYYFNVAPDDMVGAEADDLFGAALSLWSFGAARAAKTPKIRAYNPRLEENGWRSIHTVIEVVNDDMPFLVDSVTAELNRMDLTVHLVVHPVAHVKRDGQGRMTKLAAKGDADAIAESYIHAEISEQSSPEALDGIRDALGRVLSDARAAVEDWRTMRQRMTGIIETIQKAPPPLPGEEVAEACEFLRWVEDEHFTFLGYRELNYAGTGKSAHMAVVEKSGLGVLRNPDVQVFEGLRDIGALPADVRSFLHEPKLLLIMKADRQATVHRRVHMDSINIMKFDAQGRVAGEHRFVGLFTSVAYNQSPKQIPLLRRRVSRTLDRAGFAPGSHDGKAMVNILETFPRDELFQISDDELFDVAMGILHLQERQRIALFVRRDRLERFVSTLIYVPRDQYNTDLRRRMQAIVEKAFNGTTAAFYTQIAESTLARLHFIIKTTRGQIPDYDAKEIEARLIEAGRSWTDRLKQALIEGKGEERGLALLRKYGEAFPVAYRERFSAQSAVFDLDRIEDVLSTSRVGMNIYRPIEAAESAVHFKIFHTGAPVPLSGVLPMLEHMGLMVISENPYQIAPKSVDQQVWIHDFDMATRSGGEVDITKCRAIFHEAFAAVWNGEMEDDGFNRLVLAGGLNWREVTILRTYAKYLRQAAFTFSQAYIEETLANHADIARLIVRMFMTRFDPANQADAETRTRGLAVEIEHALDRVTNLDEDRILRRYLNLVSSSLRTNFFQKAAHGGPKPYLSIKLDSRKVEELPLPRPLVEVFVYSPRVEAIHLRGGKVARGGIRWSDRREDFRTEVLGLMKAQMVKNAVIVPVGSKGGFVVKRPPAEGGREAYLAEGIECYKTLMRGLLDITDNIKSGAIVAPKDVVRLDKDDPYLVVAADKGTATFSDIANGVSVEYGHWLGDAFASGGSAGYDHKKMAITARGAWESVKRHFREIGVDTQTQDFTCVGVGDMAGDVFGNGMLLSQHIKLVAAFNHMHIFLDPTPDPARSGAERKRLFDLPRSAWSDYDAKLISPGGGIFERKAKSIKISPEVGAALGIERDQMTPNELMTAILKAKVDLIYFGGIGTYVRASDESHAETGDRANDAIRINGRDLRAKVIGEGANLGMTQKGRIEYALRGGRLNTDFIDNSAGVDCSDHEVNIKILMNDVVENGDLTVKQRDQVLVEMTDEVAGFVLQDNYLQTQAISFAEYQGIELLDQQIALMRALEKQGRLDRAIEFLPSDEVLGERQAGGKGLSRPELAILLSYSKMTLYDDLLPSDLPDDPKLVGDTARYFPRRLGKQFPDAIARHRLKREIVATYMTNSLVNRVGATFVNVMMEKTGMSAPEIGRAYAISRDVFQLRKLWRAVEALDNKVPAKLQNDMLKEMSDLIGRATLWFLRNGKHPLDIGSHIQEFLPGVEELFDSLADALVPEDRAALDARADGLVKQGVPADLARRVASLDVLVAACDIVRIGRQSNFALIDVARVYFALGARFGLDWLRGAAVQVEVKSRWDRMAVGAIIDDLFGHQVQLTQRVLDQANGVLGAAAIDKWVDGRRGAVDRATQLVADLKSAGAIELAMLAVANGQMRAMMSA
jgi:glutamate dehydrogenase